MIEESAHVVESDGEYAWVETERRSSCGSCSAKGCGTGALSKILGRRSQRMKVLNPVGAKPGDEVTLGIREQVLIKGSLAVYIVPLLTMLGGGLLGKVLAPQWDANADVVSALLGLAGLVAGFLWLRIYNRSIAGDDRYMATILRVNPSVGLHRISFP